MLGLRAPRPLRSTACCAGVWLAAQAAVAVPSVLRRRPRSGAPRTEWNAASSSPYSCRSWCCTRIRRTSSNRFRNQERLPPPPARSAAPAAEATPAAAPPTAAQAALPRTAPGEAATALVSASEERDVKVENQHVVAVFTNRGARLKSWRLKDYLRPQRPAARARRQRSRRPAAAPVFAARSDRCDHGDAERRAVFGCRAVEPRRRHRAP